MIFELVYHSIAADKLTKKDILDILNTAHKFNKEHHLTGCLLYHNNEFLQILEGEEEVVRNLYASITGDERHHDLVLLATGYKKERYFDNWTMAYHEFNNGDFEELNKKIFEENIVMFADMQTLPTRSLKIFWGKIREIIESNQAA
jgi:hypothetical protein